MKTIKFKCYFCEKKVETNDIYAVVSLMIEGVEGDIIDTVQEEKICSWCVGHLGTLTHHAIKPWIEKTK